MFVLQEVRYWNLDLSVLQEVQYWNQNMFLLQEVRYWTTSDGDIDNHFYDLRDEIYVVSIDMIHAQSSFYGFAELG